MKTNQFLGLAAIVLLLFSSCGGCSSSSNSEKKFVKNPVDDLIRDMYQEDNYSIILHDMDVDDSDWSNVYKHKYRIIRQKDTLLPRVDTSAQINASADSTSENVQEVISDNELVETSIPYETITEWYEVPEKYFRAQEKNMGMAIVTKEDGKVSKVASPPGYNHYVGNRRYGYWNGGFWHFYGQYAFMSTMFGLMSRPVYYGSYNTYRSSYYGRTPYYGRTTNGRSTYGTNSAYNRSKNPSFFQRRSSKTGWSSSSKSSTSKSSGSGSNRYGTGGYRSSGGGFGK